MDGLAIVVRLQDKDARTLRVPRVVLHKPRVGQTLYQIPDADSVRRKLVVPVVRNPDFPATDKANNLSERITHTIILPGDC